MAARNSTCSTAGCANEVSARGYCLNCYKRLRRSGDLVPLKRAAGCSVEGCEGTHKARGLCKPHYASMLYRAAGECSEVGCGSPAAVRSLCPFHYGEWRRDAGSVCAVAGCDDPSHAGGYCRRHSRHLKSGESPSVSVLCAICSGEISLKESTASGRRRYVSTKTCSDCRGWRKSGSPALSVNGLIERDGSDCHLCGGAIDVSVRWPDPASATIDHIVPGSLGGGHGEDNLALAHFRCNVAKGSSLTWEPKHVLK